MNPSSFRDRYDVVIAGARCSGASLAMLLARAGMRVLAVDPLPRGRDTLSTHALMRGGVLQLARWGLLERIRAAGTPVVKTTTFYYGNERIPIPIKPADGVDGLYAPRRTVLDATLADAAEEAGVDVVHGAAVSDLVRDNQKRVRGAVLTAGSRNTTVEADLVIGADGLRSKVARLVGAPVTRAMPHATATVYGHFPDLDIEGYHWHFAPGRGAGAIATNGGATCVFAAMPPDRLAATPASAISTLLHDTVRSIDPEMAAAIAEVSEGVRLRAFPGVPGFLRQSVGAGWALAGDAGFFRDPFTAHGITDALRDAELLARAVLSSDTDALAAWQADRDRNVNDILEISDRIAAFDWTMDEIKQLHLNLSKSMNALVQIIRDVDASDSQSAANPFAGPSASREPALAGAT